MSALTPAGTGESLQIPAPVLIRAALEATTEGVVLCTAADGIVLFANAAARDLAPELTPGQAVPFTGDSFRTTAGGRHVYGMRRRLDDGHDAWFLRDHTEETEHAAALEVERARSAFLAEAGQRLSASLHVRRCARTTAELAVTHLADAAIVVMPGGTGGQCSWIRLSPGHAPEEGTLAARMLTEVPGLSEALDGFPPIPSRWLDPGQTPGWLFPADLGPVGALLVTPLPGNAETAGALILARLGPQSAFDAGDELLARVFAARAGAALAAAMLYQEQVDTTAVLQADLLPPELPQPEGFELAASYQAARDSLRVGGDFYDVLGPTPGGSDTVIALGDVCGTGPEAAVLTGKVRQTLRALRLVDVAPESMLTVLNQALLQSGRRSRFVTLVVGSVQRVEHGRVRLRLASGGHPPPLVLRTDGTVDVVPTRGTLIGVLPETVVTPATVELSPGELCLLYSDGLTEARGGPSGDEQFGEERLHRQLAGCLGMPGAVVVERLRQLVSDWLHGGPSDDIAIMAVRAHTRPPLSLRGGGAPNASPYLVSARRGDRRSRARS
ncbi:putative magnesium/manganese-dependent protein phosphatase [Actinoplanes missouriensis 431]|uniref:Putative magnesium/manganese-dependent protein phosphatase n=1 Tax=Actinoplanes missouriensis (strain ATCC 14538 / DSM 43046 / CBS 188.64 / JCM 3121 / NBRC 102363 / NCIMB 12654 / NRRL B-3342 / UNCC 431) TaxID=512565 RepID=I0HCC1_ACTM4|nr:PP2C family protein-serine/threonine phosphatase [Actinoplanes missouriensis]BAL90658.1 putative magnesium/manganese-dependent protein phosphatase [Actinoplanes missouriensis 431]